MKAIILDLETIPDPDVPFTPYPDKPDAFPPPPHHQIVSFGVLAWGKGGPTKLADLMHQEGDESEALRRFSNAMGDATLVTWNGRAFDLPVIIARCLKHGVPLANYMRGRDYRYRFSERGHLDLKDQLGDYAPTASLDTWAKLVGLPGKGDTNGGMVADLWAAGEYDRVRRYCLDDVVQTAALWLEWRRLVGDLDTGGTLAAREQLHSIATTEAA